MRTFFVSLLRSAQIVGLVASLSFYSCKDNPVITIEPPKSLDSTAIVVNQGTGSDNASLSRFDFKSSAVDVNWFSAANGGQKLGALANDMALNGDSAFVTLTKSQTIEVINVKTGKSVGRLTLTGNEEPYRILIISPTVGVVSTNNGDGVRFFNPTTLQLLDSVHTGPGTVGLATNGQFLYVANSGFGTVRDTVPGAGTITVINLLSHAITKTIVAGKNVIDLQISDDKLNLYAYYQHLYTSPDSLQGVIEYEVPSMLETRRWRLKSAGALRYFSGSVYLFNENSTKILSINVSTGTPGQVPEDFVAVPLTAYQAYGFNFNPVDGNIWISNARDFKSNGEVLVLSQLGTLVTRFNVGISPIQVVFNI